MFTPCYIHFKESLIAYYQFGKGSKVLVCLHGYGLNGTDFAFLESCLGATYTIFAIDFPYHGFTQYTNEQALKPVDLVDIIWKIIGKQQPIEILAYSMGGRVALTLTTVIPTHISKLVLMAPDGLHKNKWQWFATHTIIGNKLFKFTMQQPAWIFAILQFVEWSQLLNKSIVKFTRFYLNNKNERLLLYKRWTTMRLFKPPLLVVNKLIQEHAIPTTLVFGAYDRIILAKRGFAFRKKNPFITIETIKAGHQLLQEKYAEKIASFFVSK